MFEILKRGIKRLGAAKACFGTDVSDLVVAGAQEPFGLFYPVKIDVFNKSFFHPAVDQHGKVGTVGADRFGQHIERKRRSDSTRYCC